MADVKTVYLGLLRESLGWPIERLISSTPERARRTVEQAVTFWQDWKPGLNSYWQGEPRTAFFRWIDTPNGGGLYGDWPDWVTDWNQHVNADIWLERWHACEIVDERGVLVPTPYHGVIGIVYPIDVDAEFS